MKYMVGHNAAHANELAQLAKKLQDMGEGVAYEQVMQAVSDFEKGNMRLSTVLAALNVEGGRRRSRRLAARTAARRADPADA